MQTTPANRPQGGVPYGAIWPFLALAFGIAWGIFALFALVPDTVTRLFGEVSARHPLFILAVHAPRPLPRSSSCFGTAGSPALAASCRGSCSGAHPGGGMSSC